MARRVVIFFFVLHLLAEVARSESIVDVELSTIELWNISVRAILADAMVAHIAPMETTTMKSKSSRRRDRHPKADVHPSKKKMTSNDLFLGLEAVKKPNVEKLNNCLCNESSLERNYIGDVGNVNYGPGGTGVRPSGFWSHRPTTRSCNQRTIDHMSFSQEKFLYFNHKVPYTIADSFCDSLGLELYTASNMEEASGMASTFSTYFKGGSQEFVNVGVVRSGGHWYRYTTGESVDFQPHVPGIITTYFPRLVVQSCLALSLKNNELVEVDCDGEYFYLCRQTKKARTPKMFC